MHREILRLLVNDKLRIKSARDKDNTIFEEVAVLDHVLMMMLTTYNIYRGKTGVEKIRWIKKSIALTETFGMYDIINMMMLPVFK